MIAASISSIGVIGEKTRHLFARRRGDCVGLPRSRDKGIPTGIEFLEYPPMKRLKQFFLTVLAPVVLLATPVQAQTDNVAKLEAETKPMAMEKEAMMEEDKAGAEFVVRMKNNKFLRGIPIDLALIDVYILGTKIPVPLDQVIGVRFAAGGDEKGTIALKNGEMLSGRIDTPKVVLSVEWGEATINPAVLSAMVRDGSMQWSVRNTPNGPQWFLAPRTNRGTLNRSSSYSPLQAPVSTTTASPVSWSAPVGGGSSDSVNASEFAWIW